MIWSAAQIASDGPQTRAGFSPWMSRTKRPTGIAE